MAVGICLASFGIAFESDADWNVYVQAGIGISGALIEADGSVSNAPPVELGGMDGDSSPLLDFAVGISVPMDELLPREWLGDVRPPSWPIRFELEAAGLREYELTTFAGPDAFFTELKATTTLINTWFDIPLIDAYRPIQYLGGLGRQPRVRSFLEPGSFYIGGGIGFSALEIDATSNVVNADDDIFDFAFNVGMGMNYALSERVDLAVGYRYVWLGQQEIDATGGSAGPNDSVEYDPHLHELRVQLRVNVFDFLSPWR